MSLDGFVVGADEDLRQQSHEASSGWAQIPNRPPTPGRHACGFCYCCFFFLSPLSFFFSAFFSLSRYHALVLVCVWWSWSGGWSWSGWVLRLVAVHEPYHAMSDDSPEPLNLDALLDVSDRTDTGRPHQRRRLAEHQHEPQHQQQSQQPHHATHVPQLVHTQDGLFRASASGGGDVQDIDVDVSGASLVLACTSPWPT